MTREELIAFEADIAEEFNAGNIRAPIHLSGGNEDQLIDIFRNIDRADWVCSTWRAHYHALCHSVPSAKVKAEIMAGRSIALCFPEHRVISSAIVVGILPIALGIAASIKRNGGKNWVWAFVGDMAECSGVFAEVSQYAAGFDLPLMLVVEDNGKSVCTPTEEVWRNAAVLMSGKLFRYGYDLPWPHSGAGKRVNF